MKQAVGLAKLTVLPTRFASQLIAHSPKSFRRRSIGVFSQQCTLRSFHNSYKASGIKFVYFEEGNDNRVEVEAEEGKTMLEVAIANNIDIEGACGGELACSTCHVVCPKEVFDRLPKVKEEEEDMLDLAWGLTDT